MKIRHLEMELETLEGFERPEAALEQYATPATVAARFLHEADRRGDIRGLRVLDLGCGAGILSCGAWMLGAGEVIGIDIDGAALDVARRNAACIDADITFLEGDIAGMTVPPADSVIMNPPFGAQRVHADRPFIDAGLASAEVVWGIFNAGSARFVEAYIRGRGVVDTLITHRFPISRTFAHHTKDRVTIPVEFIRIVREEGA
ncbi:methyltransferase [Methanomicrobiaceae archaeon CYW5]|uniref:METTL5 family protein n=1 Tax=Methanovulcanius yangii TaxID=1789227 RepID=UPI0029CA081C|nr:METTL5 family protein [Methanovulcanius yangii]MBT8508134.1 methyltransferase [Methanovulcanius yangii]